MTTVDRQLEPPVETAVARRYSAAAHQREAALCCPVEYAGDYLAAIPEEIIERDYGCGDPSPFVNVGETVLDLGSGAGKLCYILAQAVGPQGRVIGVDCNQEMLQLSRRHRPTVAARLGFDNVEFRYGLIQDLALDLDLLSSELKSHPIATPQDWLAYRALEDRLRGEEPLIPDRSVDCVVSNCVLNLVRQSDRRQLFDEIFRVLKVGGRAAISDIVSDENVPESLRRDPDLWSGCISGSFREDEFLNAFADAGFHGMQVVKRQKDPWRVVDGIEFRSVTVLAYKGKQGICLERNQSVMYRGPFSRVSDDDGHVYLRGQRMAVCDKTFQLLQRAPYAACFDFIEPREEIPLELARTFDCRRSVTRSPRESKGQDYRDTIESIGPCCGTDGNCC